MWNYLQDILLSKNHVGKCADYATFVFGFTKTVCTNAARAQASKCRHTTLVRLCAHREGVTGYLEVCCAKNANFPVCIF